MVSKNKLSSWKIVFSLIFLLVITLIAILEIVHYSIESVNEEVRITTENNVKAIIEDKLKQHEKLTKDYAYWDDTIKNAFLSQNHVWIKENIGEYLTDTFNVTDLFIINGDNKAILSLKNGQVDKLNYLSINKKVLTKLIVKARESGVIPVPVSGIVKIGDTPAIVGVSVLAPEDNTSLLSPRPLLFLARRLDLNYLQELSKQYRLKDMRFISGGVKESATSSIYISNPVNKSLGLLAWQASKPGDLVLARMQFPILLLLVIIILCIAFIIKASRKTTRDLEKAYKDLIFTANHDVLTGLANRRLFNELLVQIINTARRDNITCAILYIDLDDFKRINDIYGHKVGDQVLVTIAERIKSSIRESDATARIGGDEFIVLLHSISDNEDIKSTAQKIRTSMTQSISIKGVDIQISASIGITLIPNDGTDPDTLMSKADLALYGCKNQGKNRFQFYGDLNL